MQKHEIIQKWRSGLSKNKLAMIYQREYNQHIRLVRTNFRHRYDGKFITNYEALAHIENIIYQYLRQSK